VTAEGLQPRLAKAIAALSQGDRDVLLLNALCDLSHDEIAHALGIPYGTLGSRLNRARRKVRSALGRAMDEVRMIRSLLDEAPPSDDVVAEGRRRLAAGAPPARSRTRRRLWERSPCSAPPPPRPPSRSA
jgi:predicted DNA-binding protein (UPF0251 family)